MTNGDEIMLKPEDITCAAVKKALRKSGKSFVTPETLAKRLGFDYWDEPVCPRHLLRNRLDRVLKSAQWAVHRSEVEGELWIGGSNRGAVWRYMEPDKAHALREQRKAERETRDAGEAAIKRGIAARPLLAKAMDMTRVEPYGNSDGTGAFRLGSAWVRVDTDHSGVLAAQLDALEACLAAGVEF